jgi:WD40 repeat protein
VSGCPTSRAIAAGGPQIADHLQRCSGCRALADLLASGGGDCGRAELLIAAGAASPLSGDDVTFLPAHLRRCPACRESAFEPPGGDERDLPRVAPDNYALGPEIGRGGMGRVLSARDRRIGRTVAVKEILASDPVARARFEREARITARLQHPGIVSIYEVGRWPDGRPFFAMPILPGRTLGEAIAATSARAARLTLVPAVIAAGDAVAYAHSRGIIHRDLTPSNILLGSFGETIVIDWGVAKDLNEESAPEPPPGGPAVPTLTNPGTVIGTPAYIPPEQADGDQVDERADVYALGAILYHLLSGQHPYQGQGSATVIAELRARRPPPLPLPGPPDLVSIVERAMAPDPDRRYPAASDLVDELRRWQAGERVVAHRYSGRERAARWLSRRLALLAVGSAMAVLVAISAVVGGLRVIAERNRAEEATNALLEDQGRQELLAGRPARALAYLAEAYRRGGRDPALRYLVAAAGRTVDARVATFSAPLAVSYGDRRPSIIERLTFSADSARLFGATGAEAWMWDVDGGRPRQLPVVTGAAVEARFSTDGWRMLVHGLSPEGGPTSPPQSRVVLLAGPGDALIRDLRVPGRLVSGSHGVTGARVLAIDPREDRATVWTVDQGRKLTELEPSFLGRPLSGALTADGIKALIYSPQGELLVASASTGERLMVLRNDPQDVQWAELSDDGLAIVTAGAEGAMVRDAATGVVTARLLSEGAIKRAIFLPRTHRIVAIAHSEHAQLFSDQGGAPLADLGTVSQLATSADGTLLATAGSHTADSDDGRTIRLWLADSGALVGTYLAAGPPSALAIDGWAWRLASASGAQIEVWDLRRQARVLSGADAAVLGGFIEPGGDVLTFDGAGQPRGWLAREDYQIHWRSDYPATVRGLSARRDAALLLSADRRRAEVVATVAGTAPRTFQAPAPLACAELSGDGARLLLLPAGGPAALWEVKSGARLVTLPGTEGRTTCALSADGARLFLARQNATGGELWDARTGRRIAALPVRPGYGAQPLFSPDGALLATPEDGAIEVWDAQDGRLRHRALATFPRAVAFSPDSRQVAYAMRSPPRVEVRTAGDGQPLSQLEAAEVGGMVFSPDGNFLVTVGSDATRLWDWRTQRLLGQVAGRTTFTQSSAPPGRFVDFDAAGTALAIGRRGGGVLMLDTHLETRAPDLIDALARRAGGWQVRQGRLTWTPGDAPAAPAAPAFLDWSLTAAMTGGAPGPLRNLDFEEDEPGRPPTGWTGRIGAAVTADASARGHRCAQLDVAEPAAAPQALFQMVDATAWQGKTLELRASARTDAASSRTALWLVARRDRTFSFARQEVTTTAWHQYRVVLRIGPDTQAVSFGITTFGPGKSWLDAVSLGPPAE